MIHSDRAVSEVVDFTVLLGIIILALSIVYTVGYPALKDLQESGHVDNLEQSFIVLGSNLNRVVLSKAPSQAVELKIYGGSLGISTSGNVEATVTVWNESTGEYETLPHQWNSTSGEYEVTPINAWGEVRCSYNDAVIAYQGTGVWAHYPGGTVMLSEPKISSSSDVVVVPLPAILGSDSMGGEGLVRVVADGGKTSLTSYSNVSRLDVNVTTDYNDAWARYLNESLGMTTNTSGGTLHAYVEYERPRDVVFVQKRVDVMLE